MTSDRLLIFLLNQNEETKLVQSLGFNKAQEINAQLQSTISGVIEKTPYLKFVLATDEDANNNNWSNKFFRKEIQDNFSLNARIENAFKSHIIQSGEDINKAVLIFADCIQLSTKTIENAFESLNKYDVCIGPDKKGGYYLIGMKEPLSFLFDDKLWSGNQLLDDTLEELIEHGKNYFLLPELQRVNDIYDLYLLK